MGAPRPGHSPVPRGTRWAHMSCVPTPTQAPVLTACVMSGSISLARFVVLLLSGVLPCSHPEAIALASRAASPGLCWSLSGFCYL